LAIAFAVTCTEIKRIFKSTTLIRSGGSMPKKYEESYEYVPPSEDPDETPSRKISPVVIVAIISAISAILAAIISGALNGTASKLSGERETERRLLPTIAALETRSAELSFQLTQLPTSITPSIPSTPTAQFRGFVDGVLTDRNGTAIPNIKISIKNGPQTETDTQGIFVLENVPTGHQLIIVQAARGGEFSQNIYIEEIQKTTVNLVFDTQTTQLGLLSIVAPVDGGEMEIRKDNNSTTIVHRATIFGRCDGIREIFEGSFDVWVLISSEKDGRFWVQFPAATIDPQNNTWRANVVLGDSQNQPQDGEMWTIIAVAADLESGFDKILNTPKLSLLPSHIESNVVTVVAIIK
jgi:hypothetical protein